MGILCFGSTSRCGDPQVSASVRVIHRGLAVQALLAVSLGAQVAVTTVTTRSQGAELPGVESRGEESKDAHECERTAYQEGSANPNYSNVAHVQAYPVCG
jgi:hypothetical protein